MGRLLSDEVAVVTGGGNGIGRAIAKRFADAGAAIVVADVDEDGGRETVDTIENEGGTAAFVETDVTDSDAVGALMEATVDEFGSLDVLVSNAG